MDDGKRFDALGVALTLSYIHIRGGVWGGDRARLRWVRGWWMTGSAGNGMDSDGRFGDVRKLIYVYI